MDVFSAGPYTKSSFKTLLTGMYPFSSGGYHTIKHLPTLPEILKELNYKTYAIPNNVLLSKESGYSKGFDIYVDPMKRYDKNKELMKKIGGRTFMKFLNRFFPKIAGKIKIRVVKNYLRAHEVTSRIIRFVAEENRKPIFVWAHYMDAHYPYSFLPKIYSAICNSNLSMSRVIAINRLIEDYFHFRREMDIEIMDDITRLYDTQIRYIDMFIGKLIDYLDRKSQLDNTIIIITSDHGEEFMEHGAFGHTGRRNITHLYQEILRVPLVIYHPNYTPKIVKIPVSSADIVPTIVKAVKGNKYKFDGIDILGEKPVEGRVLVSEASLNNYRRGTLKIGPKEKVAIAIRIGRWKYIYYGDEKMKNELYDLSRDPIEKNNVIDQYIDLAKIIYSDIIRRRLRRIKRDLIRYFLRI